MREQPLPVTQRRCRARDDALRAATAPAPDASAGSQEARPRLEEWRARFPTPAGGTPRSQCLRCKAYAWAASGRLAKQQHAIAAAEAKRIAHDVTHSALAILQPNLRSARGIELARSQCARREAMLQREQ